MKTFSKSISGTRLPAAVLAAALSLVGTTAKAGVVSSSDGFSVDWETVGYPWAAQRIAACSATKLFALNTDKSLYVNYSGGIDSEWQYVTTPGSADSIACDGSTLIVMNTDKSIWREVVSASGAWLGWIKYADAGGARVIGGGPGVLTALNFDQSVWTSVGDDSTSFPGQWWTKRDVAGVAARITGSLTTNNVGRFFALNTDGSLWYNDLLVLAQPGAWRPYPIGLPSGVKPVEIASAGGGLLFVLDSTNHLWSARTDGLPVPLDGQLQSNWCWAATTQMIAEYSGVVVDQCAEANYNTGRTDCCTNPASASDTSMCNKTGWWLLSYYGFNLTDLWQLNCPINAACSATGNSALSFLQLANETSANRPVAFAWHWKSGGGHAMAAIGTKSFIQWFQSFPILREYVTVNNPAPQGVGDQYDQLYTDWVSGTTYDHWRDSYGITRK